MSSQKLTSSKNSRLDLAPNIQFKIYLHFLFNLFLTFSPSLQCFYFSYLCSVCSLCLCPFFPLSLFFTVPRCEWSREFHKYSYKGWTKLNLCKSLISLFKNLRQHLLTYKTITQRTILLSLPFKVIFN